VVMSKRLKTARLGKKARELVLEVYRNCVAGPIAKDYRLKDELCRAAVSSMSNIAEGFARRTDKDFAPFLDVAKGSAIEIQSLLYVALDVGYFAQGRFQSLYKTAEELTSLIGGFSAYLRRPRRSRPSD
jgi:four helix bundle protein